MSINQTHFPIHKNLAEGLYRAAPEREDAVQHFIGSEHRDIGDRASGGQLTTIAYGEQGQRLTFGEVVALAGDYFETYDELRDLAGTAGGRANIAWARWHALSLARLKPSVPEPQGANKNAVLERYYELASQNISHFSAGGTAWQTYASWHGKAIAIALEAGERADEQIWKRALTKEAFGHHFLTDIFSAGHVRTPRIAIRAWYDRVMPDSLSRLLGYMSKFIYDRLDKNQLLPTKALWFPGTTKGEIKKGVVKLGGAAVRSFSLGDILSLTLHDYDNRRLGVVAKVNPYGHKIRGGYRWIAVGDAHLGLSSKGAPTKFMAIQAVKASLGELDRVRDAGRKLAGRSLSLAQRADAVKKALGTSDFAARDFVPKEDLTPGVNIPLPGPSVGRSRLEWRWGQLGDLAYQAVDETVKKGIADDLFDRRKSVTDKELRGLRQAFIEFTEHLRAEGIRALEKAVGKKAR